MFGGLVSPFSEPTANETAHSRLHVKLSEYGGKLLNATFYDAQGSTLYKPGDDILALHSKPPLGQCTPTIHLAGYWFDSTKQGPLVYLSSITLLQPDVNPGEDAAPMISELLKSPGGTVTRRPLLFNNEAAEISDIGATDTKWRRHASSSSSGRMDQLKAEDKFLNFTF